MSRPCSRMLLHSRNANPNGRRRDGFYGGQYQSNPRRGQEHVNTEVSAENWDDSYSQEEDQVDHWAKFIEAIGLAGKKKPSAAMRFNTQEEGRGFKEKSPRGTSFPENETHPRNHRTNDSESHRNYTRGASPRMEHGYWNEEHEGRYQERGSSATRSQKSIYKEDLLHHQRFRHPDEEEGFRDPHKGTHGVSVIVDHNHGISERMHYESRNRDSTKLMIPDQSMSQDQFRNKDPFLSSLHPRNMDLSRSRDSSLNTDHSRSREPQRSSSLVMDHSRSREPPRNSSLVMDHSRSREPQRNSSLVRDHSRSREPQRNNSLVMDRSRSREPPRNSNSVMNREFSASMEPLMNQEPSRNWNSQIRGEKRLTNSELHGGRAPPRRPDFVRSKDGHPNFGSFHFQDKEKFPSTSTGWKRPVSQHYEQPKKKAHPGDSLNSDVDLRMGDDEVGGPQWAREPGRHRGDMEEQRNPKISGAREDIRRHENLKIQVDMSRPVGQSSHLGYSSDRQLSLDLVNVGRQRLDFLPMPEHSGSSQETTMPTGTFAQEIISLVHHVKENYFRGQGIPLNERFSDPQQYTVVEEEFEDTEPIINRPFASRSSDTQVVCNLRPLLSLKHLQSPSPDDLRFDLERKRLQKLGGVKVTIAGNSRLPPQQPQGNEPTYTDVEYSRTESGRSEPEHQQTSQWDGPPAKRSVPNLHPRKNVNQFRPGARGRRNPNIGTRW